MDLFGGRSFDENMELSFVQQHRGTLLFMLAPYDNAMFLFMICVFLFAFNGVCVCSRLIVD